MVSNISFCKDAKAVKSGSVDPLHHIREKLSETEVVPNPKLPKFNGGAVGFLGYDVIKHFENIPEHKKGGLDIPDEAQGDVAVIASAAIIVRLDLPGN